MVVKGLTDCDVCGRPKSASFGIGNPQTKRTEYKVCSKCWKGSKDAALQREDNQYNVITNYLERKTNDSRTG